jgi:hypothetical protein
MSRVEGKVEERFGKEAKRRGWGYYKVEIKGRRGVPDRLLIAYSLTIWIEWKAPGGTLSALQTLMHEELRRHGQTVLIEDNYEEALAHVEALLVAQARAS